MRKLALAEAHRGMGGMNEMNEMNEAVAVEEALSFGWRH